KPSPTRRVLLSLAIAGLCGGLFTTYLQFQDQDKAAKKATDADTAREKAEKQLTDLQSKVGDLAHVESEVQSKTTDLTALNQLGDAQYYVVIDTFPGNSCAKGTPCGKIVRKLTALYPKAQTSGMLWTSTVANNQIQLRFGHHLTPSAAEIFRTLASKGLASGNPVIRRE
ncbi:MAG: hypothetical protein WBQ95_04980, partial [Terracidiphilus sp.]